LILNLRIDDTILRKVNRGQGEENSVKTEEKIEGAFGHHRES
jgi:hypothetical protein